MGHITEETCEGHHQRQTHARRLRFNHKIIEFLLSPALSHHTRSFQCYNRITVERVIGHRHSLRKTTTDENPKSRQETKQGVGTGIGSL